jgi:hypothetical protein
MDVTYSRIYQVTLCFIHNTIHSLWHCSGVVKNDLLNTHGITGKVINTTLYKT